MIQEHRIAVGFLAFVLALAAGCGADESPQVPPEPAKPVIAPEIQAVVQASLGSEGEVALQGDLAQNGAEELFLIDRVQKTLHGVPPGLYVTRAVVLQKAGEKWTEVFRCDTHLKNGSGFLGGTPILPVNGWRLQYDQDPKHGLEMFFAPIQLEGATRPPTIGVRWNPAVKRYQSLDRNFEQFLSELPSLEVPESKLVR